ncbi:transposase [Nonomuraea sp. NPDC050691]|uniref:transposase n=1 Tax=Nonomuraea sp. NPDC050691 TaxID=3155661 RepID=UPI0033E7F6D0
MSFEDLEELIPARPHLTALASRVREFAANLTQRRGHDLDEWISAVRADDLPALRGFALGLEKHKPAVIAGLTLPYSNGSMEGTNTKVKLPKRQRYGRRSPSETSRGPRACEAGMTEDG